MGRWRVVAWGGRGVYGAIYRAVRAEVEQAEMAASMALKLALLPREPRFAREEEMLSRMRHASIPRRWDHGEWQHPSGAVHPYIVMDWVDGTPLYEWARQHSPSIQQMFRVLAQLAGALKAVHAQGAVHRDVKGDNVMVRRTDGRAILIDFGSSLPPDASLLTPQSVIPGTPAYHSPEAALFHLRFRGMPRPVIPQDRPMTSARWESLPTGSSLASTRSSASPSRMRLAPGNRESWVRRLRTFSTLGWSRSSAP